MSNSLYIVFNLNSYLGGGEVIAVKLAQYLKFSGKSTILACSHESYIQRNSNNLDKIIIPSAIPLIYGKEQLYFFDELVTECRKSTDVVIICLTMRELYNAIIIVQMFKLTNVKLFFYILHPEEPNYLTSFSLNRSHKIEKNRRIISVLSEVGGVAFCSKNAIRYSEVERLNQAVCGLPFEFNKQIVGEPKVRQQTAKQKYHLFVSRLVWAKLGSCLTFLLLAKKKKKDKFGIVGYGPFLHLVKIMCRLMLIDNIVFHGQLCKDKLVKEIDKSDIGYAQGLSMLEFISKNKPVICMHYSNPIEFLLNPTLCYGCFDRLSFNDYGDLVSFNRSELFDIVEEVDRISENGVKQYIFKDWMDENSSSKVFNLLVTQIDATRHCSLYEDDLIKPTKIRKFFRHFTKWFRT